jgi:hypothetical protein
MPDRRSEGPDPGWWSVRRVRAVPRCPSRRESGAVPAGVRGWLALTPQRRERDELHGRALRNAEARALRRVGTEAWKQPAFAAGIEPPRDGDPARCRGVAEHPRWADLGTNLRRGRAVERETGEHPPDRRRRVQPPGQHAPRHDREDRLAGRAPVAPDADRNPLRRRLRCGWAEQLPLPEPVPDDHQGTANRPARGTAGRTPSRAALVDAGEHRDPGLDVDVALEDPLRAPLFHRCSEHDERGSLPSLPSRRLFLRPAPRRCSAPAARSYMILR